MLVTDFQIETANWILGLMTFLFVVGLGAVIYLWEVRKTGLSGLDFPVDGATNGMGSLGTPTSLGI